MLKEDIIDMTEWTPIPNTKEKIKEQYLHVWILKPVLGYDGSSYANPLQLRLRSIDLLR